jgi:hypothetical protein
VKPVIQPLGVGDLKVVKTKLARYDAGEVAHIENVLAHEDRKRTHRRLDQIEQIVTTEQEREEETQRDLQSTERFELDTETLKTIRSETKFEAGLELSAAYGGFSLGVFARFASNEAKEQSDKEATKYAKEITDKTLHRLVERTREERQTRSLEEVEETNKHGFNNDTSDNVTGLYRWVDKYYRAKVVNYGKRLLYQFVIPEPGAYYVWATQTHFQSKVLPVKPLPPIVPGTEAYKKPLPLTPAALARWNYLALAQQYGLEGVDPPPQYIIVGKAIAREFRKKQAWAFSNEDLEIPSGYQASTAEFISYIQSYSPKNCTLQIGTNGQIDLTIGGTPAPVIPFNGQTGKIGISCSGFNVVTFAMNLRVMCSLISEHFNQWQLRTYQAVMAAYKKALMDYEERVAAAQIQQGVAIEGDNPLLNRETEREQLEWLCLVLWSGDALENPPGTTQSGNTAPWPQRANALKNATKIEFFEEAFEWRNMSCELYPYFWGRTATREDRLALESEDPLFERFLRAGAARVVVPVKPSHTEAVLWYQLTGQIWSGGPVPALTSIGLPEATLYNSYLEDMAGVADVEEIDVDVPIESTDTTTFLMKVPTDLVWLQEDGDLPEFEKP